MITPAVDRVLNPGAADSNLPLVKLPFGGPTLYLNAFFPQRIRYVWTVFAISLVVVFIGKAVAEFLGIMLVQYVGQAAVMDLRNQVYGKLIRQPIGFFQHHPTGKVMSAVISDVECVRGALSEWLSDFFRQAFTLIFLSLVLLLINWRMALGSTLMMPLVIWPVRKLGQITSGIMSVEPSAILQLISSNTRLRKIRVNAWRKKSESHSESAPRTHSTSLITADITFPVG